MDDFEGFALAPGLRVVRRGVSHLQIGLYDGRRALVPRTPDVEHTLGALVDRRPVDPGPDGLAALATLQEHGCLVAADDHARRTRRLRDGRVSLLGHLPGARDLLARSGVRLAGAHTDADVALVGGTGEVDRDRLDPLVRRGTSHLVVRLVDGAALVGPFVVPGVTACLRCIDAHRSIADPDHVPVTNRYVRATSRPRGDGTPDVTDPVLTALALAWAVRDVVAHLDGRRPATWSRTVFLDPEPSLRWEQDWSRHPECGCSWSVHDPASGTMGV
jgi:bacteriocin biosynthesis cyclodehydratase domain-containing protein